MSRSTANAQHIRVVPHVSGPRPRWCVNTHLLEGEGLSRRDTSRGTKNIRFLSVEECVKVVKVIGDIIEGHKYREMIFTPATLSTPWTTA